jgi:hypothetical protein
MAKEYTDWHRMFGLLLMDFFTGSPFQVHLETDLSLKKQLLDVVVIHKGEGSFAEALPDGFGELAPYNLVTFKSFQETLTDFTLKELTGHYVNFLKQVSPTMQDLLPEAMFRLFAVSARYPRELARQVPWIELQQGVYECRRGTDVIRILVAGELPRSENNALLHLFSAAREQAQFGAAHYKLRTDESSTLLSRLFAMYRKEGLDMPYTMEDFRRDYVREHLKDLTPEEILTVVSAEDLLGSLSVEKRLEGVPVEKRLEGVPVEKRLEGVPVEKRLEGVSDEELAALLKRRLGSDSAPSAVSAKQNADLQQQSKNKDSPTAPQPSAGEAT